MKKALTLIRKEDREWKETEIRWHNNLMGSISQAWSKTAWVVYSSELDLPGTPFPTYREAKKAVLDRVQFKIDSGLWKEDGKHYAPKEIYNRKEMKALAEKLGVRDCWHEPDEQGVTAVVNGTSFDNAGYGPEKMVIIRQDGKEISRINLATLLALASGYEGMER